MADRIQLDAEGNEAGTTLQEQLGAHPAGPIGTISFVDVNALNQSNRRERVQFGVDAETINREADMKRHIATVDGFAIRANEAAEKSNAAFAKGDLSGAERYARQAAKLQALAQHTLEQLTDTARLNSENDANRPSPQSQNVARLQAELEKLEKGLGYKL